MNINRHFFISFLYKYTGDSKLQNIFFTFGKKIGINLQVDGNDYEVQHNNETGETHKYRGGPPTARSFPFASARFQCEGNEEKGGK